MLETEALFQLVVVGSSAGGIEALSKLVAALPIPFNAPLVIAQHLDPTRLSHLADILRRHTSLPVVSVEAQAQLKSGTIYVVPSDHHVEITDHDVTLLPDGDGRPTPSVNLLLSSAAEVYGEKLIAVILTGTGSDGTTGARTVHELGGTVIIQNPATAAYPGMPQSLAPDTVDFVVELADIGSILGDLISGKPIISAPNPDSLPELAPLLAQVREHTGIDFSIYKPATISRRLQRRLLATGSPDLASYSLYLQANPSEYDHLVADFLIKVTEFMRDPDLFSYLQAQILPKLIEYSRTRNNKELRLWSAGCATGEEAYSLAILVSELLGSEVAQFNLKIFATDLDSAAISFARRGFYSAQAVAKLSPQLLERYFVSNSAQTGYEVKKQVRNLIVFGEHDLGQRAPFPRIDMVLCRNVLIYFNRELQQHALQLFAFALRDEGYLVLGRTETVSPLAEFFDTVEPQQRVYQRQGVRRLSPPFGIRNVSPTTTLVSKEGQKARPPVARVERNLFQMQEEARVSRNARDNLLLKLPVGVVVVDSRFDIQEINSAARRMLSIHTVAIGEDFVHLAQNIPPRELSAAITRTIQNGSISTLELMEVPHLTTGAATFLQLSCYPHPDEGKAKGGKAEYALILITDLSTQITAQRQLKQDNIQQAKLVAELNQRIANLEQTNSELLLDNQKLYQTDPELVEAKLTELNQAVKQLRSELTATKRQLKEVGQAHATQMEGLVEANRGLLAANEELTTHNATLRTANEEYLMHTEEAQAAIEEADTLNEEMQASNEELETLNEELQATVEELNTTNSDLVVQGTELRERTEELRRQQQHSERERAQLAAILASMTDALVVVNAAGEVLLTNLAYQKTFGVSPPQTLVLLDEVAEKPLTLEAYPQARAARGESFHLTFSFRMEGDGSRHWWEANGQPVRGENMPDWGVIVMRDITERSLRHLQQQLFSQVAHELRTPLTIIKARIELAATWLGKQPGDFNKPLNHIEIASEQAKNLERLIADMVDATQLDNGKFRLHLSPIRLDKLLEEVVLAGQTLTTKQVLELEEEEAEGQPLIVQGDGLRLQQVFLNLIGNAISYAATSPKIVLGLRQVAAGQVEVSVQDYGPGIKAEYLSEIFSRYYQVMHGNLSTSKGLGLGLFISQQLVEGHGGTIRVESIEGEGTTFIVQLPLLKEEAQS